MSRSSEIRLSVERVRARIAIACERAGRDPEEITVVAVSKRFPLDDIAHAYDAGIRDFGENRVQELAEKVDAWEGQYPGREVRWHMVGHLQRNKAKLVVQRSTFFHGLDSLRLADALDRATSDSGLVLPCLVQVNVSQEASKFGFGIDEAESAVRQLQSYGGLSVRGLMTLAHPADDPEDVRPEFARLRSLFERSQAYAERPLTVLSMGMSGDFEVAIEEGATHLRLGTIIFGDRPD